jgi:hypothetical protein
MVTVVWHGRRVWRYQLALSGVTFLLCLGQVAADVVYGAEWYWWVFHPAMVVLWGYVIWVTRKRERLAEEAALWRQWQTP